MMKNNNVLTLDMVRKAKKTLLESYSCTCHKVNPFWCNRYEKVKFTELITGEKE